MIGRRRWRHIAPRLGQQLSPYSSPGISSFPCLPEKQQGGQEQRNEQHALIQFWSCWLVMASGSCTTHIWRRINRPVELFVVDRVVRTGGSSFGPAVCQWETRSTAKKTGEAMRSFAADKQHFLLKRQVLESSKHIFSRMSLACSTTRMQSLGSGHQCPPCKSDRMRTVGNSALHCISTTMVPKAFSHECLLEHRALFHTFSHKLLAKQGLRCKSIHSTISSQPASIRTDCRDQVEEPSSQPETLDKPLAPLKKPYLEMNDQLMSYLLAHNNEEEIFARLREETGKLPGAGASMQVRYVAQSKTQAFHRLESLRVGISRTERQVNLVRTTQIFNELDKLEIIRERYVQNSRFSWWWL